MVLKRIDKNLRHLFWKVSDVFFLFQFFPKLEVETPDKKDTTAAFWPLRKSLLFQNPQNLLFQPIPLASEKRHPKT